MGRFCRLGTILDRFSRRQMIKQREKSLVPQILYIRYLQGEGFPKWFAGFRDHTSVLTPSATSRSGPQTTQKSRFCHEWVENTSNRYDIAAIHTDAAPRVELWHPHGPWNAIS